MRRATTDPDLLRQVTDRLARVLADQAPRRAQAPLAPEPPPPVEMPDPGSAEVLEDRPAARPFRRVHLGVICALLLIGLLWAGWALLRARPVAIAAPGSAVSVSTPAQGIPTSSSPPSASAAPVRLVVHVLGAVRRPGLVTLPDGSRVQDALHAAGGLTRRADPGELNLAQLVTDGEQIVIGTRGRPAGEVRDGGGGSGSDTSKGGGSSGAALDLNRATQAQLEELPGVGPVTAGKILAWREEHRRFSRVEELQEIDGIGPKTYAQIAPHVRV